LKSWKTVNFLKRHAIVYISHGKHKPPSWFWCSVCVMKMKKWCKYHLQPQ